MTKSDFFFNLNNWKRNEKGNYVMKVNKQIFSLFETKSGYSVWEKSGEGEFDYEFHWLNNSLEYALEYAWNLIPKNA